MTGEVGQTAILSERGETVKRASDLLFLYRTSGQDHTVDVEVWDKGGLYFYEPKGHC